MDIASWGQAISDAFANSWSEIVGFLPRIVGAILVFLIGLVVAWFIKWILIQFFNLVKIQKLSDEIKLTDVLKKMRAHTQISEIIGMFVYWIVVIIFLLPVFQILGLGEINVVLFQVLGYIPNVVVAGFMIFVGVLVADLISNLIKAAAVSLGSSTSEFLASVARYAIIIFVSLAALSQLGVATYFLQTLFTAFLAFLAIAGGLAFGLGGKDAAKDLIERLKQDFTLRK